MLVVGMCPDRCAVDKAQIHMCMLKRPRTELIGGEDRRSSYEGHLRALISWVGSFLLQRKR